MNIVSTGEVASADSHAHPLDISRFHLQQMDSIRSRTPTSTELDASYMGYVCVTVQHKSNAQFTINSTLSVYKSAVFTAGAVLGVLIFL